MRFLSEASKGDKFKKSLLAGWFGDGVLLGGMGAVPFFVLVKLFYELTDIQLIVIFYDCQEKKS